jgi:hypothetical protein
MATKPKKQLSRQQLATAEIDARIYLLIMQFLDDPDLTTNEILGYFRAIYAQGYTDCLKDPEGQRGKWIKDLGYGVKGVEI